MPLTISKDKVLTVVDLLQERKLVHLFCNIRRSISALADIVAALVNKHELEPNADNPEWRGIILGGTWQLSVDVIHETQKKIKAPGMRKWNAAVHGRYGKLHAVGPYADAVQGVMGYNLFFVLLRNYNEDIWNALWPSIVDDTQVLAVNCELFSEKGDFAYIDWGEE